MYDDGEREPLDLRRRAGNGYAVWPLALVDLLREPPEATAWSRLHTRQAFVYGIAASLAYLVLLALPLLVVIPIPSVSTTAVVWIYGLGLMADAVGGLALAVVTLGYRERTLRGEVFAIPYVTAVADRLFPLDR